MFFLSSLDLKKINILKLNIIIIVIRDAIEGWKIYSKKKNNKFEKAKLAMEMKLYLYKKLITSVLISSIIILFDQILFLWS